MKYPAFSRIGCAAVCISLAAALGCGCSVPPLSPASSALQTEPLPYDSTSLEDGRLRILYSNNSSGGDTVLCGGKVLYQGSSAEELSLVSSGSEASYYWRTWPDNTASSGRRCGLYDKTGTELLSLDGNYSAQQTGGLLVLSDYSFMDMSYQPCHVFDLATLQELTTPENAYSCIACGGQLVYNCYTRPAGLAEDEYDEEADAHISVVVQRRDGTVLHTFSSAEAYDLNNYDGSAGLDDWVEICFRSDDPATFSLYNTATGEEMANFEQLCGSGTASFSTGGQHKLVNNILQAGHPVLGSFDDSIRYYFPGYAVLWSYDDGSGYELYDLTTGEVTPLCSTDSINDTIVLYATDGRLQVRSLKTGELITDAMAGPVPDGQSASVYDEGSGYVWLEVRDSSFNSVAVQIYGPDGFVCDLTGQLSKYNYLNFLQLGPDGQPLYYGSYESPSSGANLYDVLKADGSIVVHGLSTCYSYYSNSLNNLPEGVFVAQRGFNYGWMDTSGQWVYCRSIFSTLDAEDGSSYYY